MTIPILTQNLNETITMTSLELVQFINEHRRAQAEASGVEFPSRGYAELRHDHFMVKVPEVIGEEAAPKFLGTAFYTANGAQKERAIYRFPKREACLMAMSYSYEIQAKVFDRMTELEESQAPAVTGYAESTPLITASVEFKALSDLAQYIGLDKNAATISANQAIAQRTGLNFLQLLGTTHLIAPDQQHLYFTPTELGRRLSVSARQFNMLLLDAGLQEKDGDKWVPTEAAEGLYRLLDTGKRHGSGAMITQVKWSDAVLGRISTEGL